jgi:hypothetical protein
MGLLGEGHAHTVEPPLFYYSVRMSVLNGYSS